MVSPHFLASRRDFDNDATNNNLKRIFAFPTTNAMAPAPEVLKRKRSRPSEWWAAPEASSTPKQVEVPTPEAANVGSSKATKQKTKKTVEKENLPDATGRSRKGITGSFFVKEGRRKEKPKEVEQPEEEEDELLGDTPVKGQKRVGEGKKPIGREKARRSLTGKLPGPSQEDEEDLLSEVRNEKRLRGPPAVVVRDGPTKEKKGLNSLVEGEDNAGDPAHEDGKLRRGRSSNTGVEVQAVVEAAAREHDVSKKQKRRPAKAPPLSQDTGQEGAHGASTVGERKSKKRGRSPAVDSEPNTSTQGLSQAPASKSKRPRRSDAKVLEEELLRLSRVPGQERATTRTRHSGGAATATQESNLPYSSQENIGRKQARHGGSHSREAKDSSSSKSRQRNESSRRTRRSDVEIPDPEANSTEVQRPARSKKRAQHLEADLEEQPEAQPAVNETTRKTKLDRPSKPDVEVETATSNLTKGRPKKVAAVPRVRRRSSVAQGKSSEKSRKQAEVAKGTSQGSQLTTQRNASTRRSLPEPTARKRKSSENKAVDEQPVKRRRVEKDSPPGQDEAAEEEPSPPYPHLAAVVHRVSHQTIGSKWEPLPPAGVEHISKLLHDLQRPVVVRLKDEKKRSQASAALQTISRRLTKKISRGLPFPPGTRKHREDDFDFEKILDHNRALEAQLTPALHANELLEAELGKELAYLESEKSKLAELETNAKGDAVKRNAAARQLHLLLQTDSAMDSAEIPKENIGVKVDDNVRSLDHGIQSDEHLKALVQDIEGHMDSIQGNLKQVAGVSEAIAKTKAAVQADLFDRLNTAQYEEVVLGSD